MKNKGIIVNGGKFNAKNLIVGDNSTIELSHQFEQEVKHSNYSSKTSLVADVKQLIEQGEIKEAIQILLSYFKNNGKKDAINIVILLSSSFNKLQMQESVDTISHDQAKIDRSKIVNSLLQLIDNEIDT